MALSLPINTPSAGNSPSSDDSSNHPLTPVSPGDLSVNLHAPPQSAESHTGAKRKPSRRANTAERRATHNAVERQRRETLNGRFLDLAALLPNLSQIRRPSKSSIVNSSIAHIHASRRHRLLASRELRTLKSENDTLRRELNEWRSRSGHPLVEEPVRGEGFAMVLSGEIEVLATIPDDDDENGQDYDGYDEGNDDFTVPNSAHSMGSLDDSDEMQRSQLAAMMKNANAKSFAHNLSSNGAAMGHLLAASRGPMIATSPTTVSFENPAMASLYEPTHHHTSQQQFPFFHQMSQDTIDKWMPNPSPQQLYSMRNAFTSPPAPPSSAGSGGVGTPVSNSFADQAFFATFQRQQQQLNALQQQQGSGGLGGGMGHMYGSPIEDDASSGTGSVHSGVGGGRQRSGSSSNGSNGYMTPPHASPTGSFDLSSVMGDVVVNSRRSSAVANAGLQINTGSGGWRGDVVDGMGMGLGLNGMMKQNMSQPISVGGGGGGGGFMSMMF